ncbi:MAG TPA: hypothetical protein VHA06_12440 [Candidatus Angelobacter sp.]|jgi:hypothetical protein|nr:hypothetical protein [Candidatus Angelobacter sp.]
MPKLPKLKIIFASILFLVCPLLNGPVFAAPQSQPSAQSSPQQKGMMMLTIFLEHDQSKTLDEINQHLKQTGFTDSFPPEGTEVVSWYVMMGIGQVVTLRFPADKLRDVNLAIEHGAWGAYRTEFYPTYDYLPVWKASKQSGK